MAILIYIAIVVVLFWFNRRDYNNPVFKSKHVIPWWLSGISIYMIHLSVDQGQLLSGLVARHGMAGLWVLWASWLGAYVVPIVFAPIWKKLNFLTDNQFLLFRYPGKSGEFLHAFRAVYVGGLVASLLVCFHLIGVSRVAEVYFDISDKNSILLIGFILILYAFKNVFDLKIKTDALHYVLFFVAFLLSFYFVWKYSDGWQSVQSFFSSHADKKRIFPEYNDGVGWFSIFAFLGVQWWSANLFDGGGPEMARYTAVENSKQATWAGLLSPFLSLLLGTFLLIQVLLIMASNNVMEVDSEKLYVFSIFERTPDYLKGLIFLGFFGMFITSAEALMNWGASFLTIDLFQKHCNPDASPKTIRKISFIAMLILSLLAILFALQIDNLESLIKIVLSISAGVAPVYILRWIWFRINAWSQLSAMLSSGVYTLLYPYFHESLPLHNFPMSESRLLFVTFFTMATWIIVTYLTKDQSKEVQERLSSIRGEINVTRFSKRFILALILGLVSLLVVVGFWSLILG